MSRTPGLTEIQIQVLANILDHLYQGHFLLSIKGRHEINYQEFIILDRLIASTQDLSSAEKIRERLTSLCAVNQRTSVRLRSIWQKYLQDFVEILEVVYWASGHAKKRHS